MIPFVGLEPGTKDGYGTVSFLVEVSSQICVHVVMGHARRITKETNYPVMCVRLCRTIFVEILALDNFVEPLAFSNLLGWLVCCLINYLIIVIMISSRLRL
jgi:hypothetical protein